MLSLSIVFVGMPLVSSAYSDDTLKTVERFKSLTSYIDAVANLLNDFPSSYDKTLYINVEADFVSNEKGERVRIYDETISEAFKMSADEASDYLAQNDYDVVDHDKFIIKVSNKYQTKRLVVKTNNLETTMNATKVLGYDNEYILQYLTQDETIKAYNHFSSDPNCEVFIDLIVDLDDKIDEFTEVEADALMNGKKDHYSWGVTMMGLDVMQDKLIAESYSLPEIKVAVLDSGVIRTNKYLEGRLTDEGYNFISNTDDVTDDHGHGTHVSGIVADGTPNNVKILPVKVMNENGKGTLVTIRAGLSYALNEGASVVNLSLSTADKDSVLNFLDSTIDELVSRNIVVCVSAGNDQKDASYYYPARLDNVITIAALGNQVQIASYSNFGHVIDFALPGSSVVSTYQEGLAYKSGTSMASPHAAAAAALLKTWNPNLNQSQVKQIFIDNAVDMGDPGFDDIYGYGYINLANFDTTRSDNIHTHNYVLTVTKQPTCTSPGTKLHKCSICGDQYTTEIKSLGHALVKTVHEASCTSEGYTEAKCSRCGETFESNHTPKLSHDYQVVGTIMPTCEDSGKITYKCSMCGDEIYEYTASLGHNYKSEVTTPATHFKNGVMTYTCENCGDTYVESIKKGKHTFITTIVDPKCEEGGYTEHTCSDPSCGYSYRDANTPAVGHTYKKTKTIPATCVQQGSIIYTCEACGKTYSESIPITSHSYKQTAHTDATCHNPGSTTYTCSSCGDSYTETTPQLNHKYVSKKIAPTCEDDGYTLYTCSLCNESYKDAPLPALGHNYKITTTNPSCEKGGVITYTCTRCNSSYEKDIPARGHAYIAHEHPATCDQDGFVEYICDNCGASYIGEKINKLGHNYIERKKEATCTEEGMIYYECSRCNDSYIGNTIPKSDHTYSETVIPATCTSGGYTIYKCDNCGYQYTGNNTQPTPHNYAETVIPPTCTSKGFTIFKCKDCGNVEIKNSVDSLPHEYVKTIIPATDEYESYSIYKCANCGHEYKENANKKHNFVVSEIKPTCTNGGYSVYRCIDCGYEFKSHETEKLGHNYKDTIIPPSCTSEGYTSHVCERCGHTYSDTKTSKVPHQYTAKILKQPTNTKEGITEYTCSICGEKHTETIQKAKHTYDVKVIQPTYEKEGYTLYRCVDGDYAYKTNIVPKLEPTAQTVEAAPAHQYNSGNVDEAAQAHVHAFKDTVKSPTYVVRGYTLHECVECGYSYRDNYVDCKIPFVASLRNRLLEYYFAMFGKK